MRKSKERHSAVMKLKPEEGIVLDYLRERLSCLSMLMLFVSGEPALSGLVKN